MNVSPTEKNLGQHILMVRVSDVGGLNALTTGKGALVSSAATAITGAGRLFSSVHSGNASTSGVLNEFSTAAADETVLARFTASAALAAGKVFTAHKESNRLLRATFSKSSIADESAVDALQPCPDWPRFPGHGVAIQPV